MNNLYDKHVGGIVGNANLLEKNAKKTNLNTFNTLSAKNGDLRLSASNACLPKTEISVFVTECVFFTSTCYKLHVFTWHRAAKLRLFNFLSLFRDLQKPTRFSGGGG